MNLRFSLIRPRQSALLGAALILFLCAAVLAGVGPALASDKINAPERILSQIESKGVARVLVKFVTPELESLSKASKSFQAGPLSGAAAVQRQDADGRLAQAIGRAAESAFGGLPVGVEKRHVFSTIPFAVALVTKEGLDALKNDPSVLRVEEDKVRSLPKPMLSNDGLSSPQLNMTVTQVGAAAAWAKGYTGAGWFVAILDTGILNTHEFFAGKTIVEACFTSAESDYNPSSTLCPGGTGEQYGTGAAAHYSTDSYHGTHVAGIAAGKKADESLAGVAKDASILAVKIFSDGFDEATYGDTILSWDSDQIRGMEYVYSLRNTYNIAAVNMSLGGDNYSSPCDTESQKSAIDTLRSVGVATTIAAGNDALCGAINTPACISTSVAVGAVDKSDVEASFNNWSETMVRLMAPGVHVLSSFGSSNTAYAYGSGTSMAAPHVAGAWAILKQMVPSATVTQLLTALSNSAASFTPLCDGASATYKRIQIDAALLDLLPTPTVTTSTSTFADVSRIASGGTLASPGTADVTEVGLCWIQGTGTPLISDTKQLASSVTRGAFEVAIPNLAPSTSYSLRAYATNANGTSYGDVVTVTTLPTPVPALGAWTLLVFGLLLTAGAALRRRNAAK